MRRTWLGGLATSMDHKTGQWVFFDGTIPELTELQRDLYLMWMVAMETAWKIDPALLFYVEKLQPDVRAHREESEPVWFQWGDQIKFQAPPSSTVEVIEWRTSSRPRREQIDFGDGEKLYPEPR